MPTLLAAFLILGAPPAAPDGDRAADSAKVRVLDSITASMYALEYEEAREACLIALDREDLSDEERVAVHMQAGVAGRVLDRSMESRMHFVQALKIDPDATLPNETSPKIRTFFRLIKDEVKDAAADRARTPTPLADSSAEAAAGPSSDEPTPWAAYSLMGAGAALAGVVGPVLFSAAALIYFLVLPQPIDPQTKTLSRYGLFGAIGGAACVLALGAAGAAIGGTLLWLE